MTEAKKGKTRKEGGTKKIGNVREPCLHPEHDPPQHMEYEPGVYEHTCPFCGQSITFQVFRPLWQMATREEVPYGKR